MGDKIAARAARCAPPTCRPCPGTDGATTVDAGARRGRRDRLPGAAQGGGGRRRQGHAARRRRRTSSRTPSARPRPRPTAAFGDATLYVEKVLVPARHVEIQVLCDTHGNVLTLGERECSIQRRHQKLIEETPSPALTPELREEMEAAAERACRAVGYVNAGTFEFLLGPDGTFSFIELNARLQVEHPVTELCTGIDLVRGAARGRRRRAARRSPGRAPRRGHAIEIRLNAEDPDARLHAGAGHRSRASGRRSARACASTRSSRTAPSSRRTTTRCSRSSSSGTRPAAAIARAERALEETVIEGVPTTREFALACSAATSSRAAATRPRRSPSCGGRRVSSMLRAAHRPDGAIRRDSVLLSIARALPRASTACACGASARSTRARRRAEAAGEPLGAGRRAGGGGRGAERCAARRRGRRRDRGAA